MAKHQKPIAYIEHPITQDEKNEITSKGFKIIDIAYAPEDLGKGDKLFAKPKAK